MTAWEGIVGQDRAVALLERCLQRPGHAYLLVGPAGSGIDEAAREFAARLVVDDVSVDERTVGLARRSLHVDIVEFEPEGTFFLAGQADDVILEATRAPREGVRKVLILHDVDRMNETSANRMLKTIEEPPDRFVFVLTTTNPDEVILTIRSRCQRVDFAGLADAAIAKHLVASDVEVSAADLAAGLAGGHLRRARGLAGTLAPVRRAFAEVPLRVDGTGAVAWAIVADLEAAIGAATSATEKRQTDEATAHDEELDRRGYEGRVAQARRRRLAERHKRELTRLRRDLLLEGMTAIESMYRDAMVDTAQVRNVDLEHLELDDHTCAAALVACRAGRDAIVVNEKGNLHLLNLLLTLPSRHRHR